MARIAMPLAGGFEDSEFSVPYGRLRKSGHEVVVLGVDPGETLHGKNHEATARVDEAIASALPGSFDALVIPGGHSPDVLRMNQDVVDFVRGFVASGRLVAAVCHGPQLLIEADAVKGRTLTSWPSVRKDLQNAGATWVDEEVVVDGNFVTSRKPEDLPAFVDAIECQLQAAAKGSRKAAGQEHAAEAGGSSGKAGAASAASSSSRPGGGGARRS